MLSIERDRTVWSRKNISRHSMRKRFRKEKNRKSEQFRWMKYYGVGMSKAKERKKRKNYGEGKNGSSTNNNFMLDHSNAHSTILKKGYTSFSLHRCCCRSLSISIPFFFWSKQPKMFSIPTLTVCFFFFK